MDINLAIWSEIVVERVSGKGKQCTETLMYEYFSNIKHYLNLFDNTEYLVSVVIYALTIQSIFP